MVPDERGANHAGAVTSRFTLAGRTYSGAAINRATLGIEIENLQDGRDPYTAAQLTAMGWQITQWRQRYGNLPILRHADLDPTRRRDPYQLTTDQIEQWAAKSIRPPLVNPLNSFDAWGPIGKPEGAAMGFAVPRAWLVNKVLGRCLSPERYAASGTHSVTEFERGIVIYLKARNVALVELFYPGDSGPPAKLNTKPATLGAT